MTERERIRDEQTQPRVVTYDTSTQREIHRDPAVYDRPSYDEQTVPTRPVDRVRWGPVFAGLFTALSTLTILSVLGLAIGLTAFTPGDDAGNFGLGAAIWSAVSVLLAFGLGGWMAARTAAVAGPNNGALNGAMVWLVTIPLLLFTIGGGLGTVVSTAAGIVGPEIVSPQGIPATPDTAPQTDITPGQLEQAANVGSQAAWGTLIALLLGLLASALGGYLGARTPDDRRAVAR